MGMGDSVIWLDSKAENLYIDVNTPEGVYLAKQIIELPLVVSQLKDLRGYVPIVEWFEPEQSFLIAKTLGLHEERKDITLNCILTDGKRELPFRQTKIWYQKFKPYLEGNLILSPRRLLNEHGLTTLSWTSVADNILNTFEQMGPILVTFSIIDSIIRAKTLFYLVVRYVYDSDRYDPDKESSYPSIKVVMNPPVCDDTPQWYIHLSVAPNTRKGITRIPLFINKNVEEKKKVWLYLYIDEGLDNRVRPTPGLWLDIMPQTKGYEEGGLTQSDIQGWEGGSDKTVSEFEFAE